MDAVEVIRTKRDGRRLSDEQIGWFIGRYAEGGVIADEQAAALTMAIFFNGMEPDELAVWTRAMVDSGCTLDLSGVCLLYTSPSPRDLSTSRMPSSA